MTRAQVAPKGRSHADASSHLHVDVPGDLHHPGHPLLQRPCEPPRRRSWRWDLTCSCTPGGYQGGTNRCLSHKQLREADWSSFRERRAVSTLDSALWSKLISEISLIFCTKMASCRDLSPKIRFILFSDLHLWNRVQKIISHFLISALKNLPIYLQWCKSDILNLPYKYWADLIAWNKASLCLFFFFFYNTNSCFPGAAMKHWL